MGVESLAGVECHGPTEDICGSVVGIVVEERSGPGPGGGLGGGGARVNVVVTLDVECQSVTLGDDEARRPDLDVELVDDAGGERLGVVVGVDGKERS